MDLTTHSQLCENRTFNMQSGTHCGLTTKKPDFVGKCSKIKFGTFLREVITECNLNLKLVKREKTKIIISAILLIILGSVIIYASYAIQIASFTQNSFLISAVPISIFVIGLTFIGMAFQTAFSYIQDSSIAQTKKNKVDQLLEYYDVNYTVAFEIEDIHGTHDVKTELHISSPQGKVL